MKCPNCGLENPLEAQRCDCGYDFTTKKMEKSYLVQMKYVPYGGIGRLYFALGTLGLYCIAIISGILLAGEGLVAFVKLVFIVVGCALVVNRLKNIGMSGWWVLGSFVPLLNIYIGVKCFACQERYQDTFPKRLDRTGKIIAGIVIGLFVLSIVSAIVIPTLLSQSETFHFNQGFTYWEQDDYDLAIAEFNKAIEIEPNFAEAYYLRGSTYYDKGNHEQAIADYNKAIEINPRFAEAYNNRGLAYYDKGEYDQAIADSTKAIEINPRFAEAYYFRGSAYYDKCEYDQAIADSTKAIEINPRFAEAYSIRGFAYTCKEKDDQAIADHTKAIEINPNDVKAYLSRGSAYYNKGDYGRAKADYNKALKIDPNNQLAREALRQLEE